MLKDDAFEKDYHKVRETISRLEGTIKDLEMHVEMLESDLYESEREVAGLRARINKLCN